MMFGQFIFFLNIHYTNKHIHGTMIIIYEMCITENVLNTRTSFNLKYKNL